jgi:hypothetical protein
VRSLEIRMAQDSALENAIRTLERKMTVPLASMVAREAQAMEAVRFRRRRRSATGMPLRVRSYDW